ncbi:hypothetical protein GBAR_LOCUS23964 [Geodia barretti]|uniref:Uncharacterized protein n=1 Tax=Geodia barretti TaxID=519541 RepID=A0AA35T7I3_GEOBA|nr:hypothetical protein GBAR_LOCUS23964 [Geodia barretti]
MFFRQIGNIWINVQNSLIPNTSNSYICCPCKCLPNEISDFCIRQKKQR